jgi:LacI family transcriptional regulator
MSSSEQSKTEPAVYPVRKKRVSEQAADSLREYLKIHEDTFFKLPPITELARQLGVSVVNVHRAISALSQEGLVDVVHGKGVYSGSPVARAMESPRGPAIGFVCYSERVAMDFLQGLNAFYSVVIRGALHEAGSRGYRVLLHWMPTDIMQNPGRWEDIQRFSVQHKLEGLLLLCLTEEELVQWIVERVKKPCILIDHWCKRVAIDTANPDNRGAAHLGAKHLLDAGHRDIAYIFHHKPDRNPPRLQGYKDALQEAGIPVRDECIVLADLSEVGGETAVQSLVRNGVPFSAVMTFGDAQARGALNALRSLGKEAEVVTFGMANESGNPRCAMVDLQPEQVGKLAVDRLLKRIKNPALPAEDLTSPVRLAPRGMPEGEGVPVLPLAGENEKSR